MAVTIVSTGWASVITAGDIAKHVTQLPEWVSREPMIVARGRAESKIMRPAHGFVQLGTAF